MTREENGREYSCGDNFQLYVVEKNKFTFRKNEGVLAEGTIELNAARSPWRVLTAGVRSRSAGWTRVGGSHRNGSLPLARRAGPVTFRDDCRPALS